MIPQAARSRRPTAGRTRPHRRVGSRRAARPGPFCQFALRRTLFEILEDRSLLASFLDDFEDGSATDGIPVTWLPGFEAGGTQQVVDGDFVLVHNASTSAYVTESVTTRDVSLQTQVRFLDAGNQAQDAGLFARGNGPSSYWAGIQPDGTLLVGGSDFAGNDITSQSTQTGLLPSQQDVYLQLDVVGDSISARAWRVGDPMPSDPQLGFTDATLSFGSVGVFFDGSGIAPGGRVAFRHVEAVEQGPPAVPASFVDDFEDGNSMDGSPVTWLPGWQAGGTQQVVGGDFVLMHNASTSAYVIESLGTHDVSLQTQVRLLDFGIQVANAGLFARGNGPASYWTGLQPDGILFVGGTDLAGNNITTQSTQTGFLPGQQDLYLKLDVVGDSISARAWRVGDPMPSQPQIGFADGTLNTGSVGVFLGGSGIAPGGRAAFRQVEALVHDPPTVTLGVDNSTIAEAAGVATFTAALSGVSTQDVTVELGYTGTATTGADYTPSSTQIVIPAGSLSGTVTISAVQDTVDEPDETVIVDITNVTNGLEYGSQQLTTTILDDDEPPQPDVTLSVDNADIAESGGVANLLVTLSEVTTVPVTAELMFAGTAAASDYTVSGTSVVIAAGQTSGSVSVTAIDDSEDELDETVLVDIASVTGGNEVGQQQQTITIIDDDDPATFRVTSLVSTTTGFQAEFNNELDISVLNLFDTQTAGFGPADAVLTGAATGVVAGSLVVDPLLSTVTFIKTGGTLVADSYTVTLRSAADGFKNTVGDLLDGDGNGTAGGDFSDTFLVPGIDVNAITVSLPDFVRGPGQEVHLPADTANGIPLTISDGAGVRNIELSIGYDPTLLLITAATVGVDMPPDATVDLNFGIVPGVVIVTFSSPTDLPAGSSTFVNLQARVPAVDTSAIYGKQHVLDVSATIDDGNGNEFEVIDDDAVHLVSYFGDVSGNGRINASDAAQVARVAALLDSGFGSAPLTDPQIVGDISGNSRINAADASLVAQAAALISVPQIPPIPTAITAAGGSAGTPRFVSSLLPDRPQVWLAEADSDPKQRATLTSWDRPVADQAALDSLFGDQPLRSTGAAGGHFSKLEEAIEELLAVLNPNAPASG